MAAALRQIHQDEYSTLTYSAADGVFRFTRTTAQYPSIAAMMHSYDALLRLLATDFHGYVSPRLLVDMRQAPARNDPEFERAHGPRRRQLLAGFVRVATLVNSPVGILHIQRFAREDRAQHIQGFQDERQALRYLQEPLS